MNNPYFPYKAKCYYPIGFILGLLLIQFSLSAQSNWVKPYNSPILFRDTVIANFPNDIIAISDCWVMKEATQYKMWYTCGGLNYPTDTELRSRICYATSTDGTTWVKNNANPVLDVSYDGSWDSLGVETVSILYDALEVPSQRYKMWYAGQYFNDYRYDIGYAYSADGISWTKHPTPVLEVGASTEWDNGFLEGPSVIKEVDHYKMWYCGYDAIVDGNGTDGNANIGLANSTDGINWTKHPNNPIFATANGAWDSYSVQDPHVLKEDGIYSMWYGGNDIDGYGQQVGLATSTDGINWVRSDANPVLTKGSTNDWDANTASFPSVLKNQGQYEMWYTGKDIAELIPNDADYYWELGYANSILTNINDEKHPNPQILNIIPNPANKELRIQLNTDFLNSKICIYNQLGEIINIINDIQEQNILINIERYSEGLYTIIITNSFKSSSLKFSKLN